MGGGGAARQSGRKRRGRAAGREQRRKHVHEIEVVSRSGGRHGLFLPLHFPSAGGDREDQISGTTSRLSTALAMLAFSQRCQSCRPPRSTRPAATAVSWALAQPGRGGPR